MLRNTRVYRAFHVRLLCLYSFILSVTWHREVLVSSPLSVWSVLQFGVESVFPRLSAYSDVLCVYYRFCIFCIQRYILCREVQLGRNTARWIVIAFRFFKFYSPVLGIEYTPRAGDAVTLLHTKHYATRTASPLYSLTALKNLILETCILEISFCM